MGKLMERLSCCDWAQIVVLSQRLDRPKLLANEDVVMVVKSRRIESFAGFSIINPEPVSGRLAHGPVLHKSIISNNSIGRVTARIERRWWSSLSWTIGEIEDQFGPWSIIDLRDDGLGWNSWYLSGGRLQKIKLSLWPLSFPYQIPHNRWNDPGMSCWRMMRIILMKMMAS